MRAGFTIQHVGYWLYLFKNISQNTELFRLNEGTEEKKSFVLTHLSTPNLWIFPIFISYP